MYPNLYTQKKAEKSPETPELGKLAVSWVFGLNLTNLSKGMINHKNGTCLWVRISPKSSI